MTGSWLKYFSSDDILIPDAIEILVKTSHKLPKNTIVYSNWEIINEKGKTLRQFKESNYNNLDKTDFNVRLLDGQQINFNTTLISRELFDQGCLFRNLDDPIAPDYDFFLRAALFYGFSFHLIFDSLVKYRVSSNQISHKKILKSLKYTSNLKIKFLNQLDEEIEAKYNSKIKKYQKNKPILKKLMNMWLNFLKFFPETFSDRLLIFYLNSIRRRR